MGMREAFEARLVKHGLWPKEATAVMEKVIADNDPSIKWDYPSNQYPDTLIALLWMQTTEAAIKHLEETKPKHFALAILKQVQ